MAVSTIPRPYRKWVNLGYAGWGETLEFDLTNYDELCLFAIVDTTCFNVVIPKYYLISGDRFFYSGGGSATGSSVSGATFRVSLSGAKINTLYVNGSSATSNIYAMAR